MSRRGVSQKRKVIGSDGKLVSQPTDGQMTWTKYGTPCGTKEFVGYDYRFQASPKEAEEIKQTGFYSQQWKQLRGGK
jgi:hypothetical protein